MATAKTPNKQEPRTRFFPGVQTPRDTASAVEEITRRLDDRRRAIAERNKQAELERITAEDELAAARLREEKHEVDRRVAVDDANPGGPGAQDGAPGGPKGDESRIWQVDEDKLRVRAARQGEVLLTFNEATEVIHEMRRGLDKQIVILDPATGKHIPNPESEFARNNPQIALSTAKEYDRQLAGGKEPNAMEIFIEQKKQSDLMREALGIKEGSTGELAFLDRMDKMGLIVKPGATDPAVVALLTDIKNNQNLTGKEDPQVAELKGMVKALNDQLIKDREDRLKAENVALQTKLASVESRIEQVAKEKSADSEIGLMKDGIHTIEHGADKVVGLLEGAIGQGGPKLPFQDARSKVAAVAKAVVKPPIDSELEGLEREILEGPTPPGGK
jgi:hypothetical protein